MGNLPSPINKYYLPKLGISDNISKEINESFTDKGYKCKHLIGFGSSGIVLRAFS